MIQYKINLCKCRLVNHSGTRLYTERKTPCWTTIGILLLIPELADRVRGDLTKANISVREHDGCCSISVMISTLYVLCFMLISRSAEVVAMCVCVWEKGRGGTLSWRQPATRWGDDARHLPAVRVSIERDSWSERTQGRKLLFQCIIRNMNETFVSESYWRFRRWGPAKWRICIILTKRSKSLEGLASLSKKATKHEIGTGQLIFNNVVDMIC